MPAVFQVQEKHFYCEHRLGLSRHDYNLRKVLLHQELKSESGKVLFSRKQFCFGITSPLPRRACLGLRNENRKVSLREIGLFIIPTWNYRFPIQLNLFGNTKWWTIFLRKLKKKILSFSAVEVIGRVQCKIIQSFHRQNVQLPVLTNSFLCYILLSASAFEILELVLIQIGTMLANWLRKSW